jgi:hypothetical protein
MMTRKQFRWINLGILLFFLGSAVWMPENRARCLLFSVLPAAGLALSFDRKKPNGSSEGG